MASGPCVFRSYLLRKMRRCVVKVKPFDSPGMGLKVPGVSKPQILNPDLVAAEGLHWR
jgi:hypothetical protein